LAAGSRANKPQAITAQATTIVPSGQESSTQKRRIKLDRH
jgi:hypothetical protein